MVINIQNVDGTPLNDVIVGDRHDNVLQGLGGDDTLTGGGGHDVFLYSGDALDFDGNAIGNGHDVITDFNRGLDKIDFNMAGVTSMADLTITQDAQDDVVIGFGSLGETITLVNVHHVNQTDFLFGPV